jgi:NAD(P)-dependent dehydrogenase (short-subunit alcohol dehydrogenase family)
MTKRLEGKVAIVNGGGSSGPGWGNGKCTALTFAREGARVAVVDINRAAAEETAKLISDEGGRALVIESDTTAEADVDRMVATTLSEFGKVDILAQIVGISGRNTFFDDTKENWDHVMTVNVTGTMLACRAALRPMVEQRWGRIITVSSIASLRSLGLNVPMSYGVSKAAVGMLTKLMGVEFADRGITCNCIAIGMINSPMVVGMLGDYAEAVLAMRDRGSPTGKQGTGWDTANLAAFLASEDANYVNALEIPLDAGLTMKAPDIYPREASERGQP